MIHKRIDLGPYIALLPIEGVIPEHVRPEARGPFDPQEVLEEFETRLREDFTQPGNIRRLRRLRAKTFPGDPFEGLKELIALRDERFGEWCDPMLVLAESAVTDRLVAEYLGGWEGSPRDQMLFAVGEGPDPRATRIGGAPIWPSKRPWPVSPTGEPMRFFFQINFSDSTDIVPGLPGDILTVLTDRGEESVCRTEEEDASTPAIGLLHPMPRPGHRIQAYWLHNEEPLRRIEDEAVRCELGAMHAHLVRMPEWLLPPDAESERAFDLHGFGGTECSKIGGVPHWIQFSDWPHDAAGIPGKKELKKRHKKLGKKELQRAEESRRLAPRRTTFLGALAAGDQIDEVSPGFTPGLLSDGRTWELSFGDCGLMNLFWDPRQLLPRRPPCETGHIAMIWECR